MVPLGFLLIVNSLGGSLVLCKADFLLDSLGFTRGMDFTLEMSWGTFYPGDSPLFSLSLANPAWSWSSFLVTSAGWGAVQGAKVPFWGPLLWSCSGTLIRDGDRTTYAGQSPAVCVCSWLSRNKHGGLGKWKCRTWCDILEKVVVDFVLCFVIAL